MRRTFAAVAIGLALAAGASCTLILGGNLDYYVVDGGSTTAGSGGQSAASTTSSGGASSASSGGASAASSTVSSTASTTASSGAGGGVSDAGSSCLVDGGCDTGMRCTVLSQSTGSTHCVPVSGSPVSPFAACGNDDSICPAGTWCDSYSSGVCKPFCASAADCAPLAKCIGVVGHNGVTIPGIRVCTAHCKPDDGDPPCVPGTSCQSGIDFDCVASNGGVPGTPCPNQSNSACAAGLVCNDLLVCSAWCAPVGASSPDCADAGVCIMFTNGGPHYDGTQYGYCP
jgi:hypothetical protein